MLVRPERAMAQLDAESKAADADTEAPGDTEAGWGQEDPSGPRTGGPRIQAPRPTKFYGIVELDPVRAIRDLGAVMEEVAKHLKAGGKDLTLTLEINATLRRLRHPHPTHSQGKRHPTQLRVPRVRSLMRVATWCVGGLGSRLEYICHWLDRRKPDLVALQKTFVATDDAPVEALRRAGYESVFYSRDGEYRNGWGVAVLCRMPRAKPTIVQAGLPGQSERSARFLTVRSGDLEFSSVYAPLREPRKERIRTGPWNARSSG